MNRFIIFSLILSLLLILHCAEKKKKIEINQSGQMEAQLIQPRSEQENIPDTKLTPEIFFHITSDIYKISKKYGPINNEEQPVIESNLVKMENEITNVFKKYSVTKEEFELFGERHYREIEEYRKAHSEIDDKIIP